MTEQQKQSATATAAARAEESADRVKTLTQEIENLHKQLKQEEQSHEKTKQHLAKSAEDIIRLHQAIIALTTMMKNMHQGCNTIQRSLTENAGRMVQIVNTLEPFVNMDFEKLLNSSYVSSPTSPSVPTSPSSKQQPSSPQSPPQRDK